MDRQSAHNETTIVCLGLQLLLCSCCWQAGRTQRALSLIEQADRAILLSGTPALSRPTELFTQLKSLLPRARIGKMAFEERYADTRQYGTFKKVVSKG